MYIDFQFYLYLLIIVFSCYHCLWWSKAMCDLLHVKTEMFDSGPSIAALGLHFLNWKVKRQDQWRENTEIVFSGRKSAANNSFYFKKRPKYSLRSVAPLHIDKSQGRSWRSRRRKWRNLRTNSPVYLKERPECSSAHSVSQQQHLGGWKVRGQDQGRENSQEVMNDIISNGVIPNDLEWPCTSLQLFITF